MKKRMAGLMLALAVTLTAAAAEIKLDGKNTTIGWVGTKAEGKHTGGFKDLTGTATVGDDVTSLKLDVTIDTTSLHSDNAKLTGHLKSADFFAVKEHPKATFTSTKVEKGTGGEVTITGDLTLLGKKKSISFPAKVAVTDGGLTLDSTFKINRTDFGMNYGKGKVDDEVGLTVKVDAKK